MHHIKNNYEGPMQEDLRNTNLLLRVSNLELREQLKALKNKLHKTLDNIEKLADSGESYLIIVECENARKSL